MRTRTLPLALAAVLGLASVPAHAFFEANVAGGYTLLNPSELNAQLSSGGAGTTVTEVKSGYYVSADAGIAVFPFLKLVPRVSYVVAGQGKAVSSGGSFTSTIDANLVPLELGLATDVSVPLSGLSARAGVWGGYGFAAAAHTVDVSGNKLTNLYQGAGFTAEVVGALRYSFLPFLSLSLEAGYRMANIAKLSDGAGVAFKNPVTSKEVAYDFSGVNLGGGLTFSF